MNFLEPKPRRESKVIWNLSEQTKATVKYYAEYTGYTKEEVVDKYLIQLRDDPKFLEWLQNKRRNKRALAQIFDETQTEEQDIG